MAGVVPLDDLPNTLRGTAVPEDDLPGAAPTPRKRLTGSSAIPGMLDVMDAPVKSVADPAQSTDWKTRVAEILQQITGQAKAVYGGAETAAAMGTGAVGVAAGGLNMLRNAGEHGLRMATGQETASLPSAEQAFNAGAETFTRAPRTESGQAQTEAVGKFAQENAPSVMALPGGSILSPVLRAGGGALRTAARVGANKAAARVAVGEQAAARENALRVPVEEGRQAAHDAGYVLTPEQAGGGKITTSIETMANKAKLERQASVKNQDITNAKARSDLGLPEDQPITRDALQEVRTEAHKAYEAVKNAGEMTNGPAYMKALDDIASSHDTAAKSFPHRSENPFQKVIDGLRQETMDAASAIEEVKLLRSDADKAYAARDAGLGRSYRAAAKALDDSIDANLKAKAATDPNMATAYADYRAARTQIAKSYLADKALNDATGNVDALIYARALKKGDPLSGEALQIAKFGQQFKSVAQMPERIRGGTGPGFGDLFAGGAGMVGVGHAAGALPGGAAAAALLAARPVARSVILTKPAQHLLTRPNAPAQASATQARIAQILEQIAGKSE